MRILLHVDFKKQYQKLRPGEKKKFKERRDVFIKNPFHPLLNNHSLQGKYRGYRSINIAGDLRTIYALIAEDTAYFVAIGTHPKLYS